MDIRHLSCFVEVARQQSFTKAAQKLVDAAAKEAGHTVKAYHRTDAGDFHEFDKGRIGEASGLNILGDGFYFSDRESTARQYGKNVFPVYLKQLNPYNATVEDAYKLNALELGLTAGNYQLYANTEDFSEIDARDAMVFVEDFRPYPVRVITKRPQALPLGELSAQLTERAIAAFAIQSIS